MMFAHAPVDVRERVNALELSVKIRSHRKLRHYSGLHIREQEKETKTLISTLKTLRIK